MNITHRCKSPSTWSITVITGVIERSTATYDLEAPGTTTEQRRWTFFTGYLTRFAFSRGETGHGDGKLTDNVAWHWLLDSNDGCTRGAPRRALSFTVYAKVANLAEPSGTLWRHTLLVLLAWLRVVCGRCPYRGQNATSSLLGRGDSSGGYHPSGTSGIYREENQSRIRL